jgi:predicted SAM-dependent methyltransferase
VNVDRRLANWAHRLTVRLRRRHYVEGFAAPAVARLPGLVRRKLGLDDSSAVASRRIEIGCGPFPQQGYLHVDVDPGARHLEAFAPAWQLPFADGYADEIVAIHSLEHVHPRKLVPTLEEWHRVLRPGGKARVHVPNTPALMRAFLEGPPGQRWSIMGAMLGMYSSADVRGPADLKASSDHQLMLDGDLLAWAFEQAGFERFTDLTEETTDRHTEAWKPVVSHFSLVAEATRP